MSPKELKQTANLIRQDIITMIAQAESGHPAGSLGMTDVLTTLYFNFLSYNFQNPSWENRDRVVLSHGHICPLLYALMARLGCFPLEELKTLRQMGSRLQGHPSKQDLPFIEASSGSLGHGLAVAAGMAYAAKLDKKESKIWCLMSDAEQQEGSTWEAVMLGAKYKLKNLKAIIDYNAIQLSGRVEEIMPLGKIEDKYRSFDWQVLEINGHDYDEIIKGFSQMIDFKEGPCVMIAKTIPGKGVSFMEGKWEWHGKAPDKTQAKVALEELMTDKDLGTT